MITTYASRIKKIHPWLYRLGAQCYIDRLYPRHVFIETTASCNLSCLYCPREKRNDHMDFRLFRDIISEATFYGPRSFSLHLFGEPLLYPRIFDAITYIKKKNRHHTALLTTNGTMLNRMAGEVIEANPDQILWTWRREATFTPETKERLKKWGKFRVRFIEEITPKEAYEEWKDWGNVEKRRMHNYGGNIDLGKWSAPSATTRWPCYHLWFAPAVAHNGNILLCCADPHQKEVIGKFPSMRKAWTSEKLKKIRDSHLRGEYSGICKDCDVWREYPNMFFSWQRST